MPMHYLKKSLDVSRSEVSYGKNTVMIYSPDISGHRQIYCDVLTEFFITQGFAVVLAVGGMGEDNEADDKSLSPYIEQYRQNPCVNILYLGDELLTYRGESEWQLILDLQHKLAVGWTFFVIGTALEHITSLIRLLRLPQLVGNNCALFDPGPLSIYSIQEHYTSPLKYLKGLSRRVKLLIKENFFYRLALRRWKFRACFFPVEDFVHRYNYPEFHYLPDIYRSYKLKSAEAPGFREQVISDYCAFLKKNEGRDVILYFGLACSRKGYDYMLKLVHDHQDLVFVHSGGYLKGEMYDFDVKEFRERLRSCGRIFELSGRFLTDIQLIDKFYSSTEYILMPYRRHYNSSGTLMQALEYGKPVLVPDVGYLNSLVTRNGIGLTYKHLSYDDFEAQFIRLRSKYNNYVDNVMKFHQQFSKDCLYNSLKQGLGLAN